METWFKLQPRTLHTHKGQVRIGNIASSDLYIFKKGSYPGNTEQKTKMSWTGTEQQANMVTPRGSLGASTAVLPNKYSQCTENTKKYQKIPIKKNAGKWFCKEGIKVGFLGLFKHICRI